MKRKLAIACILASALWSALAVGKSLVVPADCQAEEKKVGTRLIKVEGVPIWKVEDRFLPRGSYSQGSYGVCSPLAVTLALNSLYRWQFPDSPYDLDEVQSVLDLSGACRKGTDVSYFTQDVFLERAKVRMHRLKTTQYKFHNIADIEEKMREELRNCKECKDTKTHSSTCIKKCFDLDGLLKSLGVPLDKRDAVVDEMAKNPDTPLKAFFARGGGRSFGQIPAFQFWRWYFDGKRRRYRRPAREIFLNHGKMRPLLPLLASIAYEMDESGSASDRHAVNIVSLAPYECRIDKKTKAVTKYQVLFANTWGGVGNGPNDLETLEEAFDKNAQVALFEFAPCSKEREKECTKNPQIEPGQIWESFPEMANLYPPEIWPYLKAGDAVKVLAALRVGADPNQRNDAGETPLNFTASHGNVELIKGLLAAPGIQPMLTNKSGTTAVHSAVYAPNEKVLDILLHDERVQPDRKDEL